MASVPSPSPPPHTNPPTTNSGNSAPHFPKNQVEGATNNDFFHTYDKKPNFSDGLDHLESTQRIERFRKYDGECSRRLIEKYFSGESLYGDPVVGFEEHCSKGKNCHADAEARTCPMGISL